MGDISLTTNPSCPSCERDMSEPFYEVRDVPIHQVQLVHSREAALACPKGDVQLRFCRNCGFIWNPVFDITRMTYDEDYESTQAASPTFNRFHKGLAEDLIERFDLRGKEIIEVGCGQGEFLLMLADLGGNTGIGFDSAYRGGSETDKVKFIKEFYAEPYSHLKPDCVVCKMTLEHIDKVAPFLRSIRATVGDRPETVVFFMIPEMTRILDHRAFWDIYYEHCSYWSPGSLARAFRMARFDPINVWTDYEDHYVLIAARPGDGTSAPLKNEESPAELERKVGTFAREVETDIARWRGWLRGLHRAGKKVALWGGGSKAVTFLTTLGITEEIRYVVDINPRRQNSFIPGGGQEIVGPEVLKAYQPDAVVIMSPVYRAEIAASLRDLGLAGVQLLTVEEVAQLKAA